jgi:hypothetical protein
MGVPTSEVGYTAAMARREDHEVHKDMWWHWTKYIYIYIYIYISFLRPTSGSEFFDTFLNIILLRIYPLQNIYS